MKTFSRIGFLTGEITFAYDGSKSNKSKNNPLRKYDSSYLQSFFLYNAYTIHCGYTKVNRYDRYASICFLGDR